MKEIIEVFGKNTKEPATLSKLNQLSYLELCIKESLRMFPSVPLVGRLATEDIKLSKLIIFCCYKMLKIQNG